MAARTDSAAVAASRRPREAHEVRAAHEVPAAHEARHPRRGQRTPPTIAVAAALIALLLGALLNGPGLVTAATGLPIGPLRDAAMVVADGTARTGAALGLDRPHQWLTAARDSDPGAALGLAAAVTGAASADDRSDGDEGATVSADEEDRAAQLADPVVTGSAREHGRLRRTITAEAPLEVLLAGDSLIGAVADGFGRQTAENDLVTWHKDVRISTGLARPDMLDWHRHLQQLLDARDPDVVVLLVGGNDDQSLMGAEGGVVHYGQPGWEEEYESRIARLQAIAADGGRTVVWLEVPAMRPARLEQARQRMNAAAQRAAAGTEVVLVDTDRIVAPEGYTARVQGVQIRADDGVHLTHPGGDRVAEVVDRVLTERYDLPTG